MHPPRASFPLSGILLLAAFAACALSAAPLATRKQVIKPAPEIKTQILADGRIALSWHRYADSLYLEKRLSSDELYSPVAAFSRNQRAYTDTTLVPDVTVWYRLRPAKARYMEEYGPETSVTLSLPVPNAPRLSRIAANAVLVQSDSLAAFTGVLSVERKIQGVFSTIGELNGTVRSLRDSGLATGVYQYYRLRAVMGRFAGDPSSFDSILLELSPPSNLALSYVNDHTVRLMWQSVNRVPCVHQIEKRSPDSVSLFREAAGVSEWTDSGLGYDQRTYYRVCAISDSDSSEYSAPVSAFYVLRPATDLHADPVHDPPVHLSWNPPDSLAVAFRVERSADSTAFTALATLNGGTFSYTDSLKKRGLKCFYRVVSIASNGRTANSNVISETIPSLQDGMVLVSDTAGGERFYCDALEVTAARFAEFCRTTGRDLPESPGFSSHPDYWMDSNTLPAVNISWMDAVAFCNQRSASVGLQPAYTANGMVIPGANGYRLPSRREFLEALRTAADTTANLADANVGEPLCRTTLPTPQVVYDLIGNVWEWTADTIPDGGHVILGGAFSTPRKQDGRIPEFCYRADYASPTIGFRCILPVDSR
jgi:hypothetical protein